MKKLPPECPLTYPILLALGISPESLVLFSVNKGLIACMYVNCSLKRLSPLPFLLLFLAVFER